jgi:DNA modification methylase
VNGVKIYHGDVREVLPTLPDESVHCVVTSPPYWGLRDYGVAGQIGLEATPWRWVDSLVAVFREVRRVLRSDGVLWLNIGDSYADGGRGKDTGSTLEGTRDNQRESRKTKVRETYKGLRPKNLAGMPWRLAFALQDDGWYLRQDIIWSKPNPMPESVSDRCTKAHEYIFLLAKSENYFFDAEAIKEKASTNTHNRGGGVNPKAKRAGQHSRMREDRDPRHLVRPRSKQNASFSGAVHDIVTHRNKRSVWTFATSPFPGAHFATFPPALPKTCIMAGTSAHGSCGTCGRPFRRIVETYDTGLRQKMADGWDSGAGAHGTIHREGRESGETGQPVIATRTIGWEREHCRLFPSNTKPCVVLDPFCGAATTGLVAAQLGRSFIGIELKAEYCELAANRLAQDAPAPAEEEEFCA